MVRPLPAGAGPWAESVTTSAQEWKDWEEGSKKPCSGRKKNGRRGGGALKLKGTTKSKIARQETTRLPDEAGAARMAADSAPRKDGRRGPEAPARGSIYRYEGKGA